MEASEMSGRWRLNTTSCSDEYPEKYEEQREGKGKKWHLFLKRYRLALGESTASKRVVWQQIKVDAHKAKETPTSGYRMLQMVDRLGVEVLLGQRAMDLKQQAEVHYTRNLLKREGGRNLSQTSVPLKDFRSRSF